MGNCDVTRGFGSPGKIVIPELTTVIHRPLKNLFENKLKEGWERQASVQGEGGVGGEEICTGSTLFDRSRVGKIQS